MISSKAQPAAFCVQHLFKQASIWWWRMYVASFVLTVFWRSSIVLIDSLQTLAAVSGKTVVLPHIACTMTKQLHLDAQSNNRLREKKSLLIIFIWTKWTFSPALLFFANCWWTDDKIHLSQLLTGCHLSHWPQYGSSSVSHGLTDWCLSLLSALR